MVEVMICPNCGGNLFYADRTERIVYNSLGEEEWRETLREDQVLRCWDCDEIPQNYDVSDDLYDMLEEVDDETRLIFVREGEEAFRRAYNHFLATPNDSAYWDEEESN